MSATDVRRVVEHNGQGVPSLVHVLSTLAAYWRLCACGLEIGQAGKEGWQKKCERLESELYPLQGEIELLEKRIRDHESEAGSINHRRDRLVYLAVGFVKRYRCGDGLLHRRDRRESCGAALQLGDQLSRQRTPLSPDAL